MPEIKIDLTEQEIKSFQIAKQLITKREPAFNLYLQIIRDRGLTDVLGEVLQKIDAAITSNIQGGADG